MLTNRNYHLQGPTRPRIVEKYECSAGENEEVTVTLKINDVILGKTEIILEHKRETKSVL